jgi:hypothetical protein
MAWTHLRVGGHGVASNWDLGVSGLGLFILYGRLYEPLPSRLLRLIMSRPDQLDGGGTMETIL